MQRFVAKFLTTNRLGRWLTSRYHRHGEAWMGLRFGSGQNCWLCRTVWDEMDRYREPFEDESSITIREPEYNEDGSVKVYGMSMTATAKRQMEAIINKDPALGERLRQEMERIAAEPIPSSRRNSAEDTQDVADETARWSKN